MKYIFIVNRKASSGNGEAVWTLLEPELKKQAQAYKVLFTEYPGHAIKLARQITRNEREHTIVALGGDGTIHEVLSGIRDCSKVTFGYIPAGSGNDFVRSMGLPADPKEALENVLHSRGRYALDVGTIECPGQTRRFAVSAGMGFDAAVCHEAAHSKLKTIFNTFHLGKLTYAGIALHQLMKKEKMCTQIIIDDTNAKVYEQTLFVTVMNQPYEGGGFCFCPEAKANDGLLDVILVAGISKPKFLWLLPKALQGKHMDAKPVHMFRGKEIVVNTFGEFAIHADGEPLAVANNMTVKLTGEQISLIVPNK